MSRCPDITLLLGQRMVSEQYSANDLQSSTSQLRDQAGNNTSTRKSMLIGTLGRTQDPPSPKRITLAGDTLREKQTSMNNNTSGDDVSSQDHERLRDDAKVSRCHLTSGRA